MSINFRILRLALVSVFAAQLIVACNFIQSRENLQNCKFTFEGLEVQNYSLSRLDLRVKVGVENPNASEVVVDRLDFKLFISDREVADGKRDTKDTIPAGEKQIIDLDVSTTPGKLGMTALSALVALGDVDYRLEGTVHLDTIVGSIPYPIELQGNLKEDLEAAEQEEEAAPQ